MYKFYPQKGNKRKRGTDKNTSANGAMHLFLRLSIVIRYFAGASPIDLMIAYGVGFVDVYHSVWQIVDTIHLCDNLKKSFPTSHVKQREIAGSFASLSWLDFDNCVGCVDGILIWTNKPSKPMLAAVGLIIVKFFCGRGKGLG